MHEYNNIQSRKENQILTGNQRKHASVSRQGIIVDSMINKPSLNDVVDSLVISNDEVGSKEIHKIFTYQNSEQQKDYIKNALLPLCASTTALFGALFGITAGIKTLAAQKAKNEPWKNLPEIARNFNLNNEKHFVTYAAIQNPNAKTIIGALGIFVLGAGAFITKNCVDGFKEIWIKKQESQIQKDLQKNLINVEARTFAGKIAIVRSMMSKNAKLFEHTLQNSHPQQKSPAFNKFISFNAEKRNTTENKKQKNNFAFPSLAALTAAAAIGLTYLSLKNLQKTTKIIEQHKFNSIQNLKNLIENQPDNLSQQMLDYFKKAIVSLNLNETDAKPLYNAILRKTNQIDFSKFQNNVKSEIEKLSQTPPENFAGTPSPKPAYFSYIDDVRGHFYNWIVNFDSPFLAALFLGITAVSATSYIGTAVVEAVKNVQVAKINAQTELNLQKQLVAVELENFETKKRAAIAPLMKEYRLQCANGKDKEELKNMASNILYEIKNGPPYVYS